MMLSGWVLNKITSLQSELSETNSLTGGTYYKLPLEKKAIVNIKKLYALGPILAWLFPTKTNRDSTASYKYSLIELILDDFDFDIGMRIEDVSKLEAKKNLKINVLKIGFIEQTNTLKISPIHISHQITAPQGCKSKQVDSIWYNNQNSSIKN